MKTSQIRKAIVPLGLAVALFAIVFAGSGSANVPSGVNCSADGKIAGGGATFAQIAQDAWATGFRDDVCGAVTDAVGDKMVVYNNPVLGDNGVGITGSGAGRAQQSCRVYGFGGSDGPYNEQQWVDLNNTPGTGNSCTPYAQAAAASPKFAPLYTPKTTFPDVANGDAQARFMSFPIAGSAIAIAVNLTDADCAGGPAPTSLNLTGDEVSRLFGGDIPNWSTDAALVADNPDLANCNVAVTRVVRRDNSGTTQIFKNYLQRADVSRSNATCATADAPKKEWTFYNGLNQQWPGVETNNDSVLSQAAGNGCSRFERGTSAVNASGNPGVLDTCLGDNGNANIPGAVCYADVAEVITRTTADGKGILASLESAANPGNFQLPNAGSTRANCNFSTLSLPSGSFNGAVGLNGTGTSTATDNWATNNVVGGVTTNRGDVTFRGSAYPACGVTFAMVFKGIASGGAFGASRLTTNQRRTLYSYMSYILSSAGQDKLTKVLYQSIPSSLISTFRTGFQNNY